MGVLIWAVCRQIWGQQSLTEKWGTEGNNLYHQQSQMVCSCHKAIETSSAPGMQTFNENNFWAFKRKKKKKNKYQHCYWQEVDIIHPSIKKADGSSNKKNQWYLSYLMLTFFKLLCICRAKASQAMHISSAGRNVDLNVLPSFNSDLFRLQWRGNH